MDVGVRLYHLLSKVGYRKLNCQNTTNWKGLSKFTSSMIPFSNHYCGFIPRYQRRAMSDYFTRKYQITCCNIDKKDPSFRQYCSEGDKRKGMTQNVNFSIKKAIRQNVEERRKKLSLQKDLIAKDLRKAKDTVKQKMETLVENENIKTIPNILSLGRICVSPYLGYLIIIENYQLACCGLVLIAITDYADGWIARKWVSQSSKLGSFLDPMADKVLIATMFLTLTYNGLIPLALTSLIIFKDVTMVLAGCILRYVSLPKPRKLNQYFDISLATAQIEPTMISKVNTFVQLGLVASTLAAPVFNYVQSPYLYSLWFITGTTTIAAALSYLVSKRDTYKIFKKQ